MIICVLSGSLQSQPIAESSKSSLFVGNGLQAMSYALAPDLNTSL